MFFKVLATLAMVFILNSIVLVNFKLIVLTTIIPSTTQNANKPTSGFMLPLTYDGTNIKVDVNGYLEHSSRNNYNAYNIFAIGKI